jgi:hypothetical protein
MVSRRIGGGVDLVKGYFAGPKIVFFYSSQKKFHFSRNVVCGHTMSGCTPRFFFRFFWHSEICFLNNGCIYTYESKVISAPLEHFFRISRTRCWCSLFIYSQHFFVRSMYSNTSHCITLLAVYESFFFSWCLEFSLPDWPCQSNKTVESYATGPGSRHVQSLVFYLRGTRHVWWKEPVLGLGGAEEKTVAWHEQRTMAPPPVCHSRRTFASAEEAKKMFCIWIENMYAVQPVRGKRKWQES